MSRPDALDLTLDIGSRFVPRGNSLDTNGSAASPSGGRDSRP